MYEDWSAGQTAADAEKWIALMKQYVNPVELTAELLNTLIRKNIYLSFLPNNIFN